MPLWTRNRSVGLLVGALVLIAVSCGNAEGALPATLVQTPNASRDAPVSVIAETSGRIWLVAPTGEHQQGWAELWEQDGSLFVEVEVSPPEAVAQPAHIHMGTCSALGVVVHSLANIIRGHSLTELPGIRVSDVATGELAINLHLSFADFVTFTACGEIPSLSDGQISESQESGSTAADN